jgi:hypothetical protein
MAKRPRWLKVDPYSLDKPPAAASPSPTFPTPSKPKNPGLTGVLTLLPGLGHFYLEQGRKSIVICLGFICGYGCSLVLWPFIVIDAYVLGTRTRRGQVLRAWEWSWSSTAKPKAESVWRLVEIRTAGRTEKFIGRDSKVLDNSRSDGGLKRSLRVSREWSYEYTIDHEQARKVVDTRTIQVKDSVSQTLSVENALRKKYGYVEGAKRIYEENVEVEVPPRRKVTIYFDWKNILEIGAIVLNNQFGETVDVPYSIVIGITFDQEHVDSASAACLGVSDRARSSAT